MGKLESISRVTLCSAFFAALHVAFPSRASADSVPFYKGKELNLTIGTAPGGGFDTYGRLLARHLGHHIPGEPLLIVRNMPGAGGLNQITYLLSAAPRDGSVIGLINPSLTNAPLIAPKLANFDPLKFVWIGSINSEINTCAFWPNSNVRSIADIGPRTLMMGGVGASGGSTIDTATLRSVLGLPFQTVLGYSSLTELGLAAERGEIDGFCGLTVSTLHSLYWDAFKHGDVRVVLQTSMKSHPDLTGVTNVFSLANTTEQRQIMQIMFGAWDFGRPVVAPPDIPPERAQIIRSAFDETMRDPNFLSEAARMHLEVSVTTPEEITKLLKEMYATPAAVIDKIRSILSAAAGD